jgi:Flp pilus assembly protein TadG
MKTKQLVIFGCCLTVALIAGIMAYGTWFSPKARVKAAVKTAARAFLQRDQAVILKSISDDFDQNGLTKEKINDALTRFFAEFEKIKVVVDDQVVAVSGGTAVDTVKVIVVVTRRGEQGFALGSFGNPYPVTLKLQRQKWWQITAIEGVGLSE